MKTVLNITKGKTFIQVVRWGTSPIVYKAISAITQTAPVRITAVAHGAPDGWPVAIVSVKGMTQINAAGPVARQSEHKQATLVSSDQIDINTINASGYKAYVSGGFIQYQTPVDLTGYAARMSIKDKVGGTLLLSLTSANGGIVLNNTNKTITLTVSATASAALTWTKGVFDLEMEKDGVVTELLSGTVVVTNEVTT